jgi:hypothetical protein
MLVAGDRNMSSLRKFVLDLAAPPVQPETPGSDGGDDSGDSVRQAAARTPPAAPDDAQAGPVSDASGDGANREVVKGKDDLLLDFAVRIVIVNKTDVILRNGGDKVERDRYKIKPPPLIPARQSIPFIVLAKVVAVGNVTWIPDGGLGEKWALAYSFAPPVGLVTQKLSTSRTLNSARFTNEEDDSNTKNSELRFILIQKGPPPSPQSFLSRVTIVNDTDLVLQQSSESLTAGVFETAPPKTIPARQSIDFEVRSQGTSAQDQQQFVVGALDWTTAGQQNPETWSLRYAAATGVNPTADATIQSARLISEKKIDGTNFRFTLRDKNDPPPPRPESFVSHVVVFNGTTVALNKASEALTAGTFEARPRDAIPPGAKMEFTVRSEAKTDTGQAIEAAAGSVAWRPDGAADGEQWLIQFNESPQGNNAFSSSTIQSERFVAADPDFGTVYFFKLTEKPPPPPSPTAFVSRVVIVNNTDVTLRQKDVIVALGTFATKPPDTIAPGTAEFTVKSQVNPASGVDSISGAVVWEPEGFPRGESWTISYERTSDDTDGRGQQDLKSIRFVADPPNSKGTDFQFTLNLAPEPDFQQPEPTRQPTLRLGDKSADGWVEYLQEQLNELLIPSPKLKVDGVFGKATLDAVFAFQSQAQIQHDGTVGNQTWAALRHGPREEPSTDQRAPHTFEQQGLQARWLTEDEAAVFSQGKDELTLTCVSVGDETDLQGQKVNVFVTAPGVKRRGFVATLGARIKKSETGQGDQFQITLTDFRKTFPSDPETADVQDYVIEAFFGQELGGDFYTSTKGGFKIDG